MQGDLLLAMAVLWGVSFLAALLEPSGKLARTGIVLGCASGIAGCLMSVPTTAPTFMLGFRVADTPVRVSLGCRWVLALAVWSAASTLRRWFEHDGIAKAVEKILVRGPCAHPARRIRCLWFAGCHVLPDCVGSDECRRSRHDPGRRSLRILRRPHALYACAA